MGNRGRTREEFTILKLLLYDVHLKRVRRTRFMAGARDRGIASRGECNHKAFRLGRCKTPEEGRHYRYYYIKKRGTCGVCV